MKIVNSPQDMARWKAINLEENPIKAKASSEDLKVKKSFDNDTISISDQAKKLLEENIFAPNNTQDDSAMIEDLLRRLKESSDPSDNPYDSMLKCIQIALRIMNGDKVPEKDTQFLIENQPQMYSNALLFRRQNKNPKKYDSLFKDEKDEVANSEAETSLDSVPIASPEDPSKGSSDKSSTIDE